MAVMEIKVLPLGTGSPSVSAIVARAVSVIKASGLKYQVTPMATVVEGEAAELFDLARRVHEAVIGDGVQRLVTVVHIDDRRDRQLSMEGKVASVQEKIGE